MPKSTSDTRQVVCLALGPTFLLIAWGVGALVGFDGQGAFLALPFVLLFWIMAAVSIFWTAWSMATSRTGTALVWQKVLLIVVNVVALMFASGMI
jgi:hypothetical protein